MIKLEEYDIYLDNKKIDAISIISSTLEDNYEVVGTEHRIEYIDDEGIYRVAKGVKNERVKFVRKKLLKA